MGGLQTGSGGGETCREDLDSCAENLQGNIVLHPQCVTASSVISVSVVTFITRVNERRFVGVSREAEAEEEEEEEEEETEPEPPGIVRKKQWCEMVPCLEDEGCDLLVNKSGWTCTQPGGRVKTTTPNLNCSRPCTLVGRARLSAVHAGRPCTLVGRARSGEHVRPVRQVFVQHQWRQTDAAPSGNPAESIRLREETVVGDDSSQLAGGEEDPILKILADTSDTFGLSRIDLPENGIPQMSRIEL
ncbi:Protein FAM19A5 [Takifugu flavidus]|uniref:Protein FAM19A5 n=1 Tax=Takifugu flavidus TaxID=433684 RepID=A0A5C6NBN0_9TELE|nr:Protein FAM19A5 [Takifugu flavidus]